MTTPCPPDDIPSFCRIEKAREACEQCRAKSVTDLQDSLRTRGNSVRGNDARQASTVRSRAIERASPGKLPFYRHQACRRSSYTGLVRFFRKENYSREDRTKLGETKSDSIDFTNFLENLFIPKYRFFYEDSLRASDAASFGKRSVFRNYMEVGVYNLEYTIFPWDITSRSLFRR